MTQVKHSSWKKLLKKTTPNKYLFAFQLPRNPPYKQTLFALLSGGALGVVVGIVLSPWLAVVLIGSTGSVWLVLYRAQRDYFLGITTTLEVEMRSVIGFWPHQSRFDISRIKYIRSPNPVRSPGLEFLDIDRQRLGVFNTSRITDAKFQAFLAILRQHNKILKFLNW